MKYKDLPQWLKLIAKTRHEEGDAHKPASIDESSIGSLFTFCRTPEGQDFWFSIAHADKIPDPSTYVKVGDWIKITKGHTTWVPDMNNFVGKTVRVTSIADIKGMVVKIEGSGRYFWLEHGHFIKANPPIESKQEIMTGEIKIGDKVRLSRKAISEDRLEERNGEIGTIVQIDSDNRPYKVEWDDEASNWFRKDEVELISQSQSSRPSVGDKVRMSAIGKKKYTSNSDANPHNKIGILEKVGDYCYTVRWPDYGINGYSHNEIELADQQQTYTQEIYQQQSQLKFSTNDFSRPSFPIPTGIGSHENQVCRKVQFSPVGSRP